MSERLQKWLFFFSLHSNRWHTWFYFITADVHSNHLLKRYFLGFSTVKVLLGKRYCETFIILIKWIQFVLWLNGFLFYSGSYNPLWLLCFMLMLGLSLWFGQWDSFELASVFFWHILIIISFCRLFLCLLFISSHLLVFYFRLAVGWNKLLKFVSSN